MYSWKDRAEDLTLVARGPWVELIEDVETFVLSALFLFACLKPICIHNTGDDVIGKVT